MAKKATTISTVECPVSTDKSDRLVYDCRGYRFHGFPSNIPNDTLVLLLRRTMTSPAVPSFQAIGIEKLQVLDLSWNYINVFSSDTFKDMTSLLSLDIRGNDVLTLSLPEGMFTYLVNLKTFQIDGNNFSYNTSKRFVEQTKSLKSLDSFVFVGGDAKFAILIASQFNNLISLSISRNRYEEHVLSHLLYELQSLKKLKSITLVNIGLSAVGNYSLDWMTNIRNINVACNELNVKNTIKFLGSLTALSQLDTLILDNSCREENNVSKNLNDFLRDIVFEANLFCNLSFSSSLRRFSIQRIGYFIYDAALTKCIPNLRSVSAGHNSVIAIFDDGFENPVKSMNSLIKSITSLHYFKASYMMILTPTRETQCDADDITFEQYFLDESQLGLSSTICEQGNVDKINQGYIVLPSCLRGIQVDHFVLNSEINYFPPVGVRFSPNNSLELLDLSFTILMVDGIYFNAISVSGLNKLRIVKLRHMNIKRIYMLTLNRMDSLQDIDLSDNRFEQMNAKQLSQMVTKPLNVLKLNLSSCNLGELPSDFLRQFPRVTYLDLSFNKLSYLSLNLSWLSSNDSLMIDLSSNQLSTINNTFVNSIQLIELHRLITLKLDNNQFRCDCDNIVFLEWFQSTISFIENKKSITCNFRGIDIVSVISVRISDLEFQCTEFTRILYISVGTVLGIMTLSFITGVLLFKYRWHVRWYWYSAKCKIQKLFAKRGYLLLEDERHYICYINYLGVTDEWIMRDMIPRIESWSLGDVFVYERNATAGTFIGDAIINAINSSKTLLYVIGNDPAVGEVQSFRTSLEFASIERSGSVVIIYRDLVTFEDLQRRMPLLKSLCRPDSKYPINLIQFEGNDMFWPEFHQVLERAGRLDNAVVK